MTAEEKRNAAYSDFGDPQNYINNLRDLAAADDLRLSDIEEALRDINFIRGRAGEAALDESDILDILQIAGPTPDYDLADWDPVPDM